MKMMFAYELEEFQWFLERNFSIWKQRSKLLRSYFPFGGPLAGYNSTEGLELEMQRQLLADWLTPLASGWKSNSKNGLRILFVGTGITEADIDSVIRSGAPGRLGSSVT